MKAADRNPNWVLAICLRFQLMGLAVIAPGDVMEVKRTRVPVSSNADAHARMVRAIRKLAGDYEIATAVVEPGAAIAQWLEGTGLRTRPVSMANAMRIGGNGTEHMRQVELFGHLVRRLPKLDRLVTRLPATGEIARTERWRVPTMLAVALGLAAEASETREDVQAQLPT